MKRAQVYCTPDQFDEIKDDARLISALRVARSVNALRALLTALSTSSDNSVHNSRKGFNMLFYLGATLFEALEVVSDIRPLAKYPTVKIKLATFRRGSDLKAFTRDVLKPLRNGIVFHFDNDTFPAMFDEIDYPNYVFASHTFGHNQDRYYELADFVLVPGFFSKGTLDGFVANYEQYVDQAIQFAIDFCAIADELLTDVTQDLGFQTRLKDADDTSWT